MSEIIRVTLSRLRPAWRQILTIHLCYTGLGIILFAPLLGVLGQVLLKFSGKPALADMDLLFFALSPTGMVALVLFAAATIVISAFELGSLMAIGVTNVSGKSMGVVAALAFSLSRAKQLFHFAAWLVVKLLFTVAPFLLAGGMVAFFLISDYDINFYLAVQPPEFWGAAIIIGIIVVVMAGFLMRRLVGWSLALPLVLFVGTAPARSFSASLKLTRQSSGIILRALVAWALGTLLLGVMVTAGVHFLAAVLVPLFIDSVTLLAILFGLLTALLSIAAVMTTALASGSLALLLAALAHQLEPQFREVDLPSGAQRKFNLTKKTRPWLVLSLIAGVGVATFIGFSLLDQIQFTDDAQVIAHRGAAGAAPENTMASIRRAIADGTDWIEIDVQETADGEIVVIHDSDFMKLAGVNVRVWEANLEQLVEIDIGSWFAPEFSSERVPTLADVLAEVKGRSRLIVELKYYGHDQQLEQRVVDLIETAGMQDDTMIMSLAYAGIQKVRSLRPNWKIGLLSARAIGDLTRLDADFLAVNMALARPALVKAAHAAGKELYVWTVNDALSMSQMMSLGVDGIITDEPLLAREVLTARAELNSAQRLLLYVSPLLGFEAPSLSIESNDAESDDTSVNLELGLQQRFQDRISLPDSVLAEFTSDGCSGGLSVGWNYFAEQLGVFRERHGTRPPWESCCIEHDRAYHNGGGAGLTAAQSFAAREQADEELRACVLTTATDRGDQLRAEYGIDDEQVAALYKTIATSMHLAVRLGGMPCTGLAWRWGYGWPDCR
jgi:glycerophosphoryl diester phosphodiesterase